MPPEDTHDYRSTVFLPRTDFPMRANLSQLEPRLLERWNRIGLYRRLRECSAQRRRFVLHDGPPYANGHLHIGHAFNKILKDIIVKIKQMSCFDANYVPGWDCHGLPIEWKVEEEYRAAGKSKGTVNEVTFRKDCRAFAKHWIRVQSESFQRLGLIGDWERPYTTMDCSSEASIVAELGHFLMSRSLYRGAKPVLWSVVEQTALADAEVEYFEKYSTVLFIRFPVIQSPLPVLQRTAVAIWTTTPWTLPGNRAIAFCPTHNYVVVRITRVEPGSLAQPEEQLVIAHALLDSVMKSAGITAYTQVTVLPGAALTHTVCSHPWRGHGYDFDVPLLPADFVTIDRGTGFVHIAPGHGEDDWRLGQESGLQVPEIVASDGVYLPDVPLFAGQHVFHVDGMVVAFLQSVGALLAKDSLVHSFPHSWRSKAPLIVRTTPQWFISMETHDLRTKALKAIDATRWIPANSRNRIRTMVESRPDWCVSRQRVWGVPITVFVHRETGEPLRDRIVFDRIVDAVRVGGSDVWFTADPASFLAPEYDSADFERVTDVLDVWFDSGCTHVFALEQRPDLQWPASLYLEGSDQHRGWFQSALLESCGTRGRSPYEAVLTHGFVMAEDGQKMSKSLGNVVTLHETIERFGADILRLWVVGSDYAEDLRIGPDILKQTSDIYRRLRNTLRYLLGSLDGFTEKERITDLTAVPALERWVLHRLWQMGELVCQCLYSYNLHTLFSGLYTFCTVDLSAFYFDVSKDILYCDRPDSLRRRAVRTVFDILFQMLVRWLAPFLSFTTEEAWLTRYPGVTESIHLQVFPSIPVAWRNDGLAVQWERIRRIRRVITHALESERTARRIGSSLQAAPIVYMTAADIALLDGLDLAEIALTSSITLKEGTPPEGAYTLPESPSIAVVLNLAEGEKCQRCWKILPDVSTHHGRVGLCERCAGVVPLQREE